MTADPAPPSHGHDLGSAGDHHGWAKRHAHMVVQRRCTASGGWTGSQAATGTLDVTPTTTGAIAYTLTCSGAGYTGTATQSATPGQSRKRVHGHQLVEDIAGGTQRTTPIPCS